MHLQFDIAHLRSLLEEVLLCEDDQLVQFASDLVSGSFQNAFKPDKSKRYILLVKDEGIYLMNNVRKKKKSSDLCFATGAETKFSALFQAFEEENGSEDWVEFLDAQTLYDKLTPHASGTCGIVLEGSRFSFGIYNKKAS